MNLERSVEIRKRMINNEIQELEIENGKHDNRQFYKKLEN